MDLPVFPAGFSMQPFSFVILMNQEQFLFLVLEPEFHVLSHDEEADLPSSNINDSSGISQKWSPKNERYPQISFHVEDHKVRNDESIFDLNQKIMNNTLWEPYSGIS